MKYLLILALVAIAATAVHANSQPQKHNSPYASFEQIMPIVYRQLAELNITMEQLQMQVKNLVQANASSPACWKDSYSRGVGVPIYACDAPLEKSGELCYPPCKTAVPSFYGVGPVCWQHCEDGFTDEGALCGKSGSIVPSDHSACPWYNVCGLDSDCSKCAPVANATVHNDGCTCRIDPIVYAKYSYGRGAGYPLGCGSQQYDAGLCYDYCKTGYNGIAMICWETCPASIPSSYGAICCNDSGACNQKVTQMAQSVIQAVISAIEAGEDPTQVANAIKQALEAILGFILPLCSDFTK